MFLLIEKLIINVKLVSNKHCLDFLYTFYLGRIELIQAVWRFIFMDGTRIIEECYLYYFHDKKMSDNIKRLYILTYLWVGLKACLEFRKPYYLVEEHTTIPKWLHKTCKDTMFQWCVKAEIWMFYSRKRSKEKYSCLVFKSKHL